MNKQLSRKLEQATARVETMIHLGCMVTDASSLPEALDDLLQDDDTLVQAFPDMPEWVKAALDSRHERGEAFSEWVCQEEKFGFVIQFATPVMRNIDKNGCGSYSWGYYSTRWVYGETLEEAVTNGIAWVAKRRAAEIEKQNARAVEA